jgi:hypothetical protein
MMHCSQVDEELVKAQQAAYSVPGVDEEVIMLNALMEDTASLSTQFFYAQGSRCSGSEAHKKA